MDDKIVAELKDAGINVGNKRVFPLIQLHTAPGNVLKPIEWEADFLVGSSRVSLRFKNLRELFVGNKQPPPFAAGIPPDCERLMILLARTGIYCCSALGKPEKDLEFERLFTQLRRRPDGRDNNPIFTYLRGAAQYYLSVEDVSQAEFDGVVGWLARLARHLAEGPSSANFIPHMQKSISIPPVPGM